MRGAVTFLRYFHSIELEVKDSLIVILWAVCLCLRRLIDYVVELVTPLVLEIGRHHGVEVEGQAVDEMGEEGIVGSDSRHRSDVIRKEGGERRDSRQ